VLGPFRLLVDLLYFSICASIFEDVSCNPVSFLSTCPKVLSSERQKGMNPFRILCRDRRRGGIGERLVVDDVDRPLDLFQYPLNHLVAVGLDFAMAVGLDHDSPLHVYQPYTRTILIGA